MLPISHTIHGTGVFTYMNGLFFMVNVGKYTIHGFYGFINGCFGYQVDLKNQEGGSKVLS